MLNENEYITQTNCLRFHRNAAGRGEKGGVVVFIQYLKGISIHAAIA